MPWDDKRVEERINIKSDKYYYPKKQSKDGKRYYGTDYDYDESIILLNKMSKYHFSTSHRVIYNDIRDYVEKFMYDEALEMTEQLIEGIS